MDCNEQNIFSTMNAIDTHVHFWKYDKVKFAWINDAMKVLRQDYFPEHLSLIARNNHIKGFVAVQADQSELETHFLVELAATHPLLKGVVGWIDLRNENLWDRLEYFSQYPIIKGWRHIVQGESNDFLLRKDFQHGVRMLHEFNYSYDILIYHDQLEATASFVNEFPDHRLIIDHCAKPDIRNAKIDDWKKWMREIARQPNVFCKLSGLFTEASWKTWDSAEFYPYLDVVFEAFGTDRLVFGSDWPVILLSGIYVQWKSLLEKYMEHHSEEDKEKVFETNAIQFYQL
jgi:L-fuconolactonase